MSLTFPRTRRTQKLCLAAGMEGNGQCCLWGWLQLRYLHSWNLLRWLRYNFITLQWKLEGKVFKITNCFIFHFNFLSIQIPSFAEQFIKRKLILWKKSMNYKFFSQLIEKKNAKTYSIYNYHVFVCLKNREFMLLRKIFHICNNTEYYLIISLSISIRRHPSDILHDYSLVF